MVRYILKFFERRRRTKLYRQWVERAGLPPEALRPEAQPPEAASSQVDSLKPTRPLPNSYPTMPIRAANQVATHPDVTGDMLAEINKRERRLSLLYILLILSIVVFLVALALLILTSLG